MNLPHRLSEIEWFVSALRELLAGDAAREQCAASPILRTGSEVHESIARSVFSDIGMINFDLRFQGACL